jgi:hypothetical protein
MQDNGPLNSDVIFLFNGPLTDITETSPNIDVTSREPNPLDPSRLLNNKTQISCGGTSFGTRSKGTTVLGENKFSLKFSSIDKEKLPLPHLVAHGQLHIDCDGEGQPGVVTLDATF